MVLLVILGSRQETSGDVLVQDTDRVVNLDVELTQNAVQICLPVGDGFSCNKQNNILFVT